MFSGRVREFHGRAAGREKQADHQKQLDTELARTVESFQRWWFPDVEPADVASTLGSDVMTHVARTRQGAPLNTKTSRTSASICQHSSRMSSVSTCLRSSQTNQTNKPNERQGLVACDIQTVNAVTCVLHGEERISPGTPSNEQKEQSSRQCKRKIIARTSVVLTMPNQTTR